MDPFRCLVEVKVPKAKRFLVSCPVLLEHLPYLTVFGPTVWPMQEVPEEDEHTKVALLYLFEHLSEITKYGTSAALLDRLEDSFKRDSWRRDDTTVDIFCNLGRVLQPGWWGCSIEVFSALSTFFTRNCEKIYERDPESLVLYLCALNYMRWPMTEVLACVARHPDLAELVLLYAQDDEDPPLDLEVVEELRMMTGQRIRREEGGLFRAGHRRWGKLRKEGRRKPGHGRFIRGDQLGVLGMLEEWDRRPENVIVKVDGGRAGLRKAEQRRLRSLEHYDSLDSSEDEFGFEYSGHGRRRGRRHAMGRERGLGPGSEHERLMLTGA